MRRQLWVLGMIWLYLLLLLCHTDLGHAVTPAEEKNALLAFKETWKNNVSKDLFSDWASDSDPCDDFWQGVACDCSSLPHAFRGECSDQGPESHVLGISLNEAIPGLSQLNLGGSIPQEFVDLKELVALDLSHTNLTGTLPNEVVRQLKQLQLFSVNDNHLIGTLPSALTELPLLQVATMSNNNFSGEIFDFCSMSTKYGTTVELFKNDLLCGLPEVALRCNNDTEFRNFTFNYIGTTSVDVLTDNFDPKECCQHSIPTCLDQSGCGVMVPEYQSPHLTFSFNFTNFTNFQPKEMIPIYSVEIVGLLRGRPVYSIPLVASSDMELVENTTLRNVPYTVYNDQGIMVGNVTGDLYTQAWNLSLEFAEAFGGEEVALMVTAKDTICSKRTGSTLSRPIHVLVSGPTALVVFNTPNRVMQANQTDTKQLGLTWQRWYDPTGLFCCWYWVQFFNVTGVNVNFTTDSDLSDWEPYKVTDLIFVGKNRMRYTADIDLEVGNTYVGIVFATHEYGWEYQDLLWNTPLFELVTHRMAPPIKVVPPPLELIESSGVNLGLALGLGLGIGVPVLCGLLLLPWLVMRSEHAYQKRVEQLQKRNIALTRMMQGIAAKNRGLGLEGKGADPFGECEELAFVITDLENSTACAAADRKAYKEVQIIHDQIMREGIAEHNGYEVCTEGDSFQVAFLTVIDAVKWALETQHTLLNSDWPARVLKLPSCNSEYVNGLRSFYGPRVRMGIHWATKGTFKIEEHAVTRTRVFPGLSWLMAQEVGDIGFGGQIVMTHFAWKQLRTNMVAADFPVVYNIGLYKLDQWPQPVWLYEVSDQIVNPIPRRFQNLRTGQQVYPGMGFRVVAPPLFISTTDVDDKLPESKSLGRTSRRSLLHMASSSTWMADMMSMASLAKGHLVLVVCRIEKWLNVGTQHSMHSRGSLHHLIGRFIGEDDHAQEIPHWVLERTYAILAMVAQQFQGYIMEPHFVNDIVMLSFACMQSALSFCHSSQVMLLTSDWTKEETRRSSRALFHTDGAMDAIPAILGPKVTTPDGRVLFQGPRVAMLLHHTQELNLEYQNEGVWHDDEQHWVADVEYKGKAVCVSQAANRILYGGQVALTATAWQSLQEGVPWNVQVLNLGSHMIDCGSFTEVVDLLEVMPISLRMRDFPTLPSLHLVSPGFKDSPDPMFPMAICFAKVGKPQAVADAMTVDDSLSDDTLRGRLTTYFSSVILLEQVVRMLLPEYDGYECKNPEPGKFTLAFRDLEKAVLYNVAVQRALLEADWPQQLLDLEECKEVKDEDGKRIWRGLRLRAGITWGTPDSRKPLNTGRADYFGSVANMAARIMSAAQPGQVLLQGTSKAHKLGQEAPEKSSTSLLQTTRYIGASFDDPDAVIIDTLGYYQLKGFSDMQEICRVVPRHLDSRVFPTPKLKSVQAPRKNRNHFSSYFTDNSQESSVKSGKDSFFVSRGRQPECIATAASASLGHAASKGLSITLSTPVGCNDVVAVEEGRLGEEGSYCGRSSSAGSRTNVGTRTQSNTTLTEDQMETARGLAELYIQGRRASVANYITNKQWDDAILLHRKGSGGLTNSQHSSSESMAGRLKDVVEDESYYSDDETKNKNV